MSDRPLTRAVRLSGAPAGGVRLSRRELLRSAALAAGAAGASGLLAACGGSGSKQEGSGSGGTSGSGQAGPAGSLRGDLSFSLS